MTITNKLRKMLHRKAAEYCCPNPAGNTVAGSFVAADKCNVIPGHDIAFYVGGASAIYNYNSDEDAWSQLLSSGITGTFAAGACGCFHPRSMPAGSPNYICTAGTTTTATLSSTLLRSAAGCVIRVVSGTGVGYEGTVVRNNYGTTPVITVTPASTVAFDSTTVFNIFGGSLWFMNAGTSAVGFSVYDRLSNAWTSRSVANLPTSWGIEGQLIGTPSFYVSDGFWSATATAATSTTITLSTTKAPLLNQWANYQIRITSGTGAGQVRSITSHTADPAAPIFTVPTWTTTPDATSVCVIEGNDDYLYLLGNNSVALYRYSISSNAWTLLSPTAPRYGIASVGCTADWVFDVSATHWTDFSYPIVHTAIGKPAQNGRYIYSHRGTGYALIDVYDIALNSWGTIVTYGNYAEVLSTGSCSCYLHGKIYFQKDATGRIFRFDVANNVLEPFVLNPVPQGAAVAGRKMFITSLVEDDTELNYLYTLGNTRNELTRWLII